ncbi:cytochrome c maturation protein CcmE [Candidatus Thalassarchaeum betae]|jgi:cytochrome c-type biogenesis protein CcmE|uniref:cytochrome c maturation protein CcmE domain-containing protein n=1 Tax=Candidatus Thalassarchaeum betae TaxID=2599289 RepID=UPI0030C6D5DF|nr:cytochrome c maturation protein CcmE [Candidatus Thalassoarchaea betae]
MAGTRASRLIVVGLALVGLVALMFLSVKPETQYSVDEVMASPQSHEGDVHLRGQVVAGSLDSASSSFDLAGTSHTLHIDFSGVAIPDGFEEGHTIAVKGNLMDSSEGWLLKAHEIQTGCPSKYSE